MEKFMKWKCISSSSESSPFNEEGDSSSLEKSISNQPSSLRNSVDLKPLPSDPAERLPISHYPPNVRDEVRRAYIQKGPYQPRNHKFSESNFSGVTCHFNPSWFDIDQYKGWLEYSMKADAAFCFICYLFKTENLEHEEDAFAIKGFRSWNKMYKIAMHIGGPSSLHNQCFKKSEDFRLQKQSIQTVPDKQCQQVKSGNRICLDASINVARLLLNCGLPFEGHDEREFSKRDGIFHTLLKWYAKHGGNVGDVVKNVPKNLQMPSPEIQEDIVEACAKETVDAIIEDIGDEYFAILVDEFHDVARKGQMTLVLRYVDEKGIVMERLLGLIHVTEISSLSLKKGIYSLLYEHSLSPHQIRGQSYNIASLMHFHINDLKTSILRDSKSAHCIHWFAHDFRSSLVAVLRNHDDAEWFFEVIDGTLNVIRAPLVDRDMLCEKKLKKIEAALRVRELESGWGLNKELGPKKAGSHLKSVLVFVAMFPTVLDVLDAVANKGFKANDRIKAQGLLDALQSFAFAFSLHLMIEVLAITSALNVALQRREHDIVNVISFIGIVKKQVERMRGDGWETLIADVVSFCERHDLEIPDTEAMHVFRGKHKKRVSTITKEHFFKVNVFDAIVDMVLEELNCLFNEVNTELLLGIACLNPIDSFSDFDKKKLLNMARLYPDDFDGEASIEELSSELDNFVENIRDDSRFSNLKGLNGLSRKLVETKKHHCFPRVFLLLKLALILPVATATVERTSSTMKFIKSDLHKWLGDKLLSDRLITYVENDVFENVTNFDITCRLPEELLGDDLLSI